MAKNKEEKIKARKILGVEPTASLEEIKKAYRKLILKNHPDHFPGREENAKEINDAYEVLTGKHEKTSNYYYYEPNFQESPNSTEQILVVFGENRNQISDKNSNNFLEAPNEIEPLFAQKSYAQNARDFFFFSEEEPIQFSGHTSDKKDFRSLFEAFFRRPKPLNYDSSNVDLQEYFIKEKINKSEKHYPDSELEEKIQEEAFLWSATKDGCAPIYLLGTMHLTYGAKLKDIFLEAIKNVLSCTDTVFTETTLRPSEDREFPCLDAIVAEIADEMGKQLKPLENEKIRSMLGVNLEQVESLYKEGFLDLNNLKQGLKEATKQYLSARPLSNEVKNKQAIDITAPHKRNKYWMEDILNESKNGKSTFVACGAIHNCGKYGLPNLLASEGYTVTPIMKQPPVPTSSSIRWFERTGNNHLNPWNFPITLNKEDFENPNGKEKEIKGLLKFEK